MGFAFGQQQSQQSIEGFVKARVAELLDSAASHATSVESITRRRMPLLHLADRIVGKPLCITKDKLDTILKIAGSRILTGGDLVPLAYFDDDEDEEEDERDDPQYWKFQNGVATIPIHGTLMKRTGGLAALSGASGYESLKSKIAMAFADPKVKAVIYDVDSPGGESSGMFDLADYMFSLRGQKPTISVCNDEMCSAAYAIGSSADQIYISRTGIIGSVGCYMLHVDQSVMDEKDGLKYTYIAAGAKKVEGNPHEPLDKSARSMMQGEVDRIRSMFVSLVARNRNVTADAVMATEAGIEFGPAAIPLFADKLGTYDDALSAAEAMVASANEPGDKEGFTPDEAQLAAAASGTFTVTGKVSNGVLTSVEPNSLTNGFVSNWNIIHTPSVFAPPIRHTDSSCTECDGSGMCGMCDGSGKMGGGECAECSGTGKCQACDGSGKMKSLARLVNPANLSYRMLMERGAVMAQFGRGIIGRVAQIPGSKSSTGTGRKITMLVVPYDDQCSINLGGFREVYQRGAFAEGLDNDPRALFNHDEAYVLGRKAANTATFWEDAEGVHVECEAPETTWANDLLVSMRRNDISQASAAFWVLKQRWEQRNGDRVRVVEKALLRDASVLAFAAYETTSATAEQAPTEPESQTSLPEANPDAYRLDLMRRQIELLRLR